MNLLASLRYLAALDDHKHFGRAAAACHITQPALLNAMRALEEELGAAIVKCGRSFGGFTAEGLFGASLIGVAEKLGELHKGPLRAVATVAAGFTTMVSLLNIGGRFFWASQSDKMRRKMSYIMFFVLGGLMYFSVPGSDAAGSIGLFVGAFCVILSRFGGGFATAPAYLADILGTRMVSAIHGHLLTAWATAGVLGPVVVNYMREYQLGLGISREQAYNQTMYIQVGMLVVGLICNLLVKPLDAKWLMTDAELAAQNKLALKNGCL